MRLAIIDLDKLEGAYQSIENASYDLNVGLGRIEEEINSCTSPISNHIDNAFEAGIDACKDQTYLNNEYDTSYIEYGETDKYLKRYKKEKGYE